MKKPDQKLIKKVSHLFNTRKVGDIYFHTLKSADELLKQYEKGEITFEQCVSQLGYNSLPKPIKTKE
jgi:hypothetical protein